MGITMRTFHRHSYNLLSVCLFGLGLWMGFGQDLLGQNNRSKYQVYTVQKGDDLVSLMSRFGMCQTHFLALNPELRDLINHSGELSELSSESSVIVNSPNYIKSRKFIDHKVGRKETLFGIAKYYGLSANDLLADNPGIRRSGLRKGDRLKIVQNCSAISDIESMRIRDQLSHQFINIHEVAPNESLSSIADRYKMSLTELKALNQNLSDSLEVGQSIKIRPVALDTVVPVKDHFDYYVVQSKEGFFRLKQKFGLTKDEILNLQQVKTLSLYQDIFVIHIDY